MSHLKIVGHMELMLGFIKKKLTKSLDHEMMARIMKLTLFVRVSVELYARFYDYRSYS